METNRGRQVFFQARLDKKQESMKQALSDNMISLASTPEDVLVIKTKSTSDGDTIQETLSEVKTVQIVFPVLKDVPIRKIKTQFSNEYTVTALVSAYGSGSEQGSKPQDKMSNIEVMIPLSADIDVDDKIVRVFVSDVANCSSFLTFKVVDLLGNMSNNTALQIKAVLQLENEPPKVDNRIFQSIKSLAARRVASGY